MKRRIKKTAAKARELSDVELADDLQTAHLNLISAIAKCTERGLRVDCGRDVGTPIKVFRPITGDANG